jgi:hypothetical protein
MVEERCVPTDLAAFIYAGLGDKERVSSDLTKLSRKEMLSPESND